MPRPGPYRTKLEEIEQQTHATETLQEVFENQGTDDNKTRQTIAKIFVYIYFALLALIIIGTPIYNLVVVRQTGANDLVMPLKDLIQTYSAVVGPTLGFVIAYYFKSKND